MGVRDDGRGGEIPSVPRTWLPRVAGGLLFVAAVACSEAAGQTANPAPASTPPAGAPPAAAPVPAGGVPAAPAKPRSQRLRLETTDGIQLVAWYYPALSGTSPTAAAAIPAVVILLHDLEGTHQSVEPLALSLQQRGMSVIAPDLRGHGESTARSRGQGLAETVAARSLKKPDFEAMARSSGGRIRGQAAERGDVEAVYGWLREQADAGKLDLSRLFVVGSGLGAAVASQWVVADAAWPETTSGPQGGMVRGLVLVSPTWTTRGYTMSPAIGAPPLGRTLPIFVVAGRDDADATKLFGQLKRQRADEWYEKRAGAAPAQATKLTKEKGPSIYLMQIDASVTGDALAAHRSPDPRQAGGDPANLVAGFIATVSARQP
jgi:alpha-beta hydrolase superfamily lysophospholipase